MTRKELANLYYNTDEFRDPKMKTLYDKELMKRYDIPYDLTWKLMLLLRRGLQVGHIDPMLDTYRLDAKSQGQDYLEMIQESLHQGIEGYDDEETFIIETFLADIAYSLTLKV